MSWVVRTRRLKAIAKKRVAGQTSRSSLTKNERRRDLSINRVRSSILTKVRLIHREEEAGNLLPYLEQKGRLGHQLAASMRITSARCFEVLATTPQTRRTRHPRLAKH